jgi:hypothetical protein
MSAAPHFPLFNTHFSTGTSNFHLFPNLPKELRLNVWNYALQRHRIIRVQLSEPDLEDSPDIKSRFNERLYEPSRALETNGTYRATMHDISIHSKFFRVCRESRHEAFRFYRIPIPCRLLQPNEPECRSSSVNSMLIKAVFEKRLDIVTTPGTFYFNPEWDCLRISCWPNTSALLPPFLHDLRTLYDPRGVGLQNLVVSLSSDGGEGSLLDLEPSTILPRFHESVKHTFQQLQEVFFYDTHGVGRYSLGLTCCISDGWWFNRSVPLHTRIPTFERFTTDPRPISADLEKQYMGEQNWREIFQRYQRMLSRFSVAPAQITTQFKIMIAHESNFAVGEIRGREDAERWLKVDCERWWVDRSKWPDRGREVFEGQDYVMESQPAFGFWLFPVEAAEMTNGPGDKKIFDMRMYRPELGLAVM